MKDKKYKYLEDAIEDYLQLMEQQIEIPLQIAKAKEKYEAFLKDHQNDVLDSEDAQHAFKIHSQINKFEESKKELEEELSGVETCLKGFLGTLSGSKISFEKKDENKSKMTFLFWMEGEELKSNRF
ncbi:MAG: hypothetical protein M3040_09790 [Bacteroidota bacterium]|nr:hypothetical protein [Bacteroidota bacterium]